LGEHCLGVAGKIEKNNLEKAKQFLEEQLVGQSKQSPRNKNRVKIKSTSKKKARNK
jgi:hypothetical protein